MTNQHPITPPPELVQRWCHEDGDEIKTSPRWYQIVATKAAQWGADMELDACCKWLSVPCPSYGRELCNARRPKPPSLKEQALAILDDSSPYLDGAHENIIRRALEQLND